MNRNFISFLMLISLVLPFFVSCAPPATPDVSESNVGSDVTDGNETEPESNVGSDVTDGNETEPESNVGSDVTGGNENVPPINISVKPSNGKIDDFYTDDEINPVSCAALSDYVTSESCSDSLLALYSDSDEFESVPILGTYLEKTNLYVCLFKKQGSLIGTKALMLDSNGTVVSELEELLGESVIGTRFTDSYCFAVVSHCVSSYPEFEIKGIVYDDSGYTMVYPVGNQATDETILYYDWQLNEFGWVDSFTSLEEGRKKFDIYWDFRSTTISQIPIYEWTTVALHPTGYINAYRYDYVYSSGIDVSSCQYLFDFDWFLLVPLLDEAGEEGEYVLHLLYQKDKLIAEVVLQRDSDVIKLINERVSDIDVQTNEYVGLDSIDYVEQISHLSLDDSKNIRGIGYDGEKFYVVYD